MKIILASASPRRKELVKQIGLEVEICPSQIEEKITSDDPSVVVMELSRQKADDIASHCKEDAVVLGADTVVAADGKILGKPATKEEAIQMLTMLQGRKHQVYTGVTLIRHYSKGGENERKTFAEKTDVTVYPMDREEILAYTESGEPMDKAGAYGIQGKFAAYIATITGDYNNVVGLPAGRVYQELKKGKFFCPR